MNGDAVGTLRRLAGDAVAEARTVSLGMWGLLLLLATETALFAALLSSYFFLRWQGTDGWPPGELPDPKLLRPSIYTGAILLSALPLVAAQRAIARDRQWPLRVGLLAAIGLGLAFLGFQIWDWVEKTKEFTPQRNAYASLVYLLTGAHVVHVLFGLALLAWVSYRAFRGAYESGKRLGVAVAAVYWYWVVGLALTIYLVVVISPRW